jgi:hypothetical protein
LKVIGTGLFQPTPSRTTVGDLNRDGHPDLVGVYFQDVMVLLGKGDGTFALATTFPVPGAVGDGNEVRGVTIADVDGDHAPDLIVTLPRGVTAADTALEMNEAFILLGNGDGTFRTATSLFVGPLPNSSAVGDLDGDGIPDLAVGLRGAVVGVFPGKGDGTFGPESLFGSQTAADFVLIRRMNGDRRPDLVVAGGTGVSILINDTTTPPDCSRVSPAPPSLWPPDGRLAPVRLAGAVDADNHPASIAISGVLQDESTGPGGDAHPGNGPDVVLLRARRDGSGDGRVYAIAFTATDPTGLTCSGTVRVCVPHDQAHPKCGDGGGLYRSEVP